jgi:hypothetical protein
MNQITPAHVETLLRFWGYAFGVRPPAEDAEEAEGEGHSTIARCTVDRSREGQVIWRRDPILWGRVGVARRMIQEQVGKRCPVPAWAGGDPIRAPRSFQGGSAPPPEVGPEAERVEQMVLSLQRFDPRAALSLRAAYCLLGRRPLSERIAWVTEKSGTNVSRMGYRAALSRGRAQVQMALSEGRKNIG